MKYLNTKHERDSAKITTLIIAITLLVLFIVGPKYMEPPEEYGVTLKVENSESSYKATVPKVSKSRKEVIEENEKEMLKEDIPVEDIVEESLDDAPEIQKQKELLTQQLEEVEHIKKEVEATTKAKEIQERKADFEATKVKKVVNTETNKTVPFNLLQEYPIYPGCENAQNNDAKRTCMNTELKKFMIKNFDTNVATNLNLSGILDVKIHFIIDSRGEIAGIKAKASRPELESEAVRVFKMLPKMKPAIQQGKAVNYKTYIPIKIQMGK